MKTKSDAGMPGKRAMMFSERNFYAGFYAPCNAACLRAREGFPVIYNAQLNAYSSLASYCSSRATQIHPFYFIAIYCVCIFASVMALLDLDKIVIKRTILGIRCTYCGGNLVIAKNKSIIGRLIKLLSFGTIQPKNYECENCKKPHLLL